MWWGRNSTSRSYATSAWTFPSHLPNPLLPQLFPLSHQWFPSSFMHKLAHVDTHENILSRTVVFRIWMLQFERCNEGVWDQDVRTRIRIGNKPNATATCVGVWEKLLQGFP